jgi:hypothetical protein
MEAPKLEEPFSGARGILLPELRRRVAPPHPAIVARMVVGAELKLTWRRMSRLPGFAVTLSPMRAQFAASALKPQLPSLLLSLIALIDAHNIFVTISQAACMDDNRTLSTVCTFDIGSTMSRDIPLLLIQDLSISTWLTTLFVPRFSITRKNESSIYPGQALSAHGWNGKQT